MTELRPGDGHIPLQFLGSSGKVVTAQGQTGPMCGVLWEVVLGSQNGDPSSPYHLAGL